ncbi:hypothetical protein [Trinickia acidisoli]|uniref:hypothetical protein n=1 Tax=Trinickia acidisoli TaxID=2767482 RepID=UPI001A8F2BE0|nr:hypothetical protein [Trinickia acidisoli]
MIDSVRLQTESAILEKAKKVIVEKFGWRTLLGTADHTASLIRLNEPSKLLGIIPFGWSSVDTSPTGYVLDFKNHDANITQSLMITPSHCDLVISISSNQSEQIDWIRKHANLFFNPEIKLGKEEYGTKYTVSLQEDSRHLFTSKAIDAIAKQSANRIVNAFKDEAFAETRREKIINFQQWHFPFYSAWLAYKRREYPEAAVRATLDTIALAGGPFGKGLSKIGIVTKSGTLRKVGNGLQKLGKLDVPGAVDGVKEGIAAGVAKKVGGPAAEWFAEKAVQEINQGPNTNTLNNLVDHAYSGRSREKAHMEGVARNT